MENEKMTSEYQNLAEFLQKPGQTISALMRDFNKERLSSHRQRVSASTFYGWCRGDFVPTKHWDMMTLSKLTEIPADKLFSFIE